MFDTHTTNSQCTELSHGQNDIVLASRNEAQSEHNPFYYVL